MWRERSWGWGPPTDLSQRPSVDTTLPGSLPPGITRTRQQHKETRGRRTHIPTVVRLSAAETDQSNHRNLGRFESTGKESWSGRPFALSTTLHPTVVPVEMCAFRVMWRSSSPLPTYPSPLCGSVGQVLLVSAGGSVCAAVVFVGGGSKSSKFTTPRRTCNLEIYILSLLNLFYCSSKESVDVFSEDRVPQGSQPAPPSFFLPLLMRRLCWNSSLSRTGCF